MRGCDFLILVLGLAGSTGVAMAEQITQLGRRAGAKVIVIGVQPFAFEGLTRRERSITAIANLRSEADSVLVLSNDRLNSNSSAPTNVRHSFHFMHQLLSQAAQALAQVVCKRGLIQLSFADVRSLYGRYVGTEALENCWIAHVEGDIHDSTDDLIQRLLDSPLLGDESIWKHVDHAIVTVSGTRDLGLSDVQEMVGAFQKRLQTDIAIATSAALDDEQHDRVRMTVLLAMTAPIPSSINGKPVEEPAKTPLRLLGDTAPLPSIPAAAVKPAKAKPAPAAPVVVSAPAKPVKAKPARPAAPQPVIAREEPLEEDKLPVELPARLLSRTSEPTARPRPATCEREAGRNAVRGRDPGTFRENARDDLSRRESRPADLPPPPPRDPTLVLRTAVRFHRQDDQSLTQADLIIAVVVGLEDAHARREPVTFCRLQHRRRKSRPRRTASPP